MSSMSCIAVSSATSPAFREICVRTSKNANNGQNGKSMSAPTRRRLVNRWFSIIWRENWLRTDESQWSHLQGRIVALENARIPAIWRSKVNFEISILLLWYVKGRTTCYGMAISNLLTVSYLLSQQPLAVAATVIYLPPIKFQSGALTRITNTHPHNALN